MSSEVNRANTQTHVIVDNGNIHMGGDYTDGEHSDYRENYDSGYYAGKDSYDEKTTAEDIDREIEKGKNI